MMFGDFNKPFKPARTDVDWLSRDPAEVDAYVADPLCGFPFTTQLAIDLLDALPGLLARDRLARIRKDLPIYVFSGERDPVGANVKGLIEALKAAGFTKLTTRIYPGARHETLNETNRDEVTADLDRLAGRGGRAVGERLGSFRWTESSAANAKPAPGRSAPLLRRAERLIGRAFIPISLLGPTKGRNKRFSRLRQGIKTRNINILRQQ